MNEYKTEYIREWLVNPDSHRFCGHPAQFWVKDFQDIINSIQRPLGTWTAKENLVVLAPKGNIAIQPQLKARKVDAYFVTVPWYECSVAKYIVTQMPRKAYGKTQCLVWDFDHTNIEQSYTDMQKLVQYLYNKTGQYPTIHYTGKKGFHVYIYLEYPVNSYYKDGVEQVLEQITRSADIYIPTNSEIQRAQPKYTGEDKIELEDIYWTVDRAVWQDVTFARLIRIPFTPRDNGNYCWPITAETSIDDIHKKEKVTHRRLIMPELTQIIINAQNRINRTIAGNIEAAMIKQATYQPPKSKESAKEITNWAVVDKIFPQLYETGTYMGDRYIVKCPFHNDNNPSAFYSDKVFFCSACRIKVDAWHLLIDYAGKSKEEAREIMLSVQ